jgi:type IV secretion/conjugal transfer VirB4 family ATPase
VEELTLKRDIRGLSDLIEHFSLVADGIVLTTTGTYVAGFEFTGPDMDSMSVDDAFALARRIASRLTLGGGFTLQCDLCRSEHLEYCDQAGDWPDSVSSLIDQERRIQFSGPGISGHRLSRYFLSLSYEPAMPSAKGAARWFFAGDDDHATAADRALAVFQSKLEEFESLLAANLPCVRRLKSFTAEVGDTRQLCCEFLQFVRRCICGEDFRFAVPDAPAYLNQYLATDDFLGGAVPQLGHRRIAVLAIDAFPERSFAGILRELDSIAADFRFSMAGQLLDSQEAAQAHKDNRERWGSRKTPAGAKITQRAVSAAEIDLDAAELEMDASRASSAAAHGRETSMHFSAKAIVMEADELRLSAVADQIKHAVQRCGFSCRIETLNAIAAYLSSIPGQHKREGRTFLVTGDNYSHMMPLSAPFRGHRHNPSPYFPPQSAPLFYAVTSGGTPYRWNPYVGDVGHVLIDGPTGGGKSTFLGLSVASFLRYPQSQVVVFDKKRSLYTLCRALGGSWYNLSPDGGPDSRLCLLQNLETPGQRKAGTQLIELLVSEAGLEVSPDVANSIKTAIDRMAKGHGGRSLTDFCMAVDDHAVAVALESYLGGILDGDRDNLSLARLTVFEMDELYRLDKRTMNGAIFAIVAKMRQRLSSSIPTLVCCDEFREALSQEFAAKAFNEFLLEGRKLNTAVFLVVQELSKVLDSPLRTAVLESCLTRVLLPNPQATAEGASAYEALGLSARDREIIANAQPKSDYYIASPDGKRLVSLELGQLALSFLAASSDKDCARVDLLMSRHPHSWQVHWLRERGATEWADVLEQKLTEQKKEFMYV